LDEDDYLMPLPQPNGAMMGPGMPMSGNTAYMDLIDEAKLPGKTEISKLKPH
jgi:hypothetical protein